MKGNLAKEIEIRTVDDLLPNSMQELETPTNQTSRLKRCWGCDYFGAVTNPTR
jgi:hypothetical protein